MSFDTRGIRSFIWGEDLIDAIKNRNINAILLWIDGEDGYEYICKEHDEPDTAGYFNHYWVNSETNEVIYDENDPKEAVKIEPMDITKTETNSGWIAPDGKFYECEFEGHARLANQMILYDIVYFPDKKSIGDCQEALERAGWAKLSSQELRFYHGLNKKQKDVIIDYYLSINRSYVIIFERKVPIPEFMETTY